MTATTIRDRNLIGGEWTDATGGVEMEVVDPATGEPIARVPRGGLEDARTAIEAASEALPAWRDRPAPDRALLLRRLADLMTERNEELARLLTREEGKPLDEARGEIVYATSFIEWAAGEADRLYGDIVPGDVRDRRILVMRQPVGVCGLITPWNFPAAMITRKLGPALAAGCTVVCKPAEQTPLSALALGELCVEAGFPPGVVNVVCGEPEAVGREMLANPTVRKLSFTGSVEVGKELVRLAAENLPRLSLELGGHAPFIVFADADLDAAVEGALASKFRNMGQTCICANRFLVHEDVHDAFRERLEAELRTMTLGHGLEDGVDQGPLIDEEAVAKVRDHVADALDRGATLRCGGSLVRPSDDLLERFWEPTILEECGPGMACWSEETFGPVAPIRRFTTEEEAVELANDSRYGLAASFFTRDASRLMRVAEALEYGIVGANDGGPSTARAPFGGMKESGLGREGGKWVMDEYTETKYVSWRVDGEPDG